MKDLKSIVENYEKDDWGVVLDDRFGRRLAKFLTEDEIVKIGFEIDDDYKGKHKPIEWTRENILAQLKEDVAFGFEKALGKRGISASLMFEVVNKWNKVLEEGLENYGNSSNYSQYGLPLFKATAVKYGWNNPIGDDNGDELKYSEDGE